MNIEETKPSVQVTVQDSTTANTSWPYYPGYPTNFPNYVNTWAMVATLNQESLDKIRAMIAEEVRTALAEMRQDMAKSLAQQVERELAQSMRMQSGMRGGE
jgi:hypothetical protein